MQFHIENMTCQHCAQSVTNAIRSAADGAEVEVDIATKSVKVRTEASEEQIQRALTEAGYPPDAANLDTSAHGAGLASSSRGGSAATALIAGVLAVFASPGSHAAGALSDVWWSPESPGWALTIEHRTQRSLGIIAERGYAVLNAFDTMGGPRWHVAVLSSAGFHSNGLPALQGPIYETRQDPGLGEVKAAATSTEVGYMYIDPVTANRLTLEYEIDGETTHTTIQRYTALPETLDGHFSATNNVVITHGSQIPQTAIIHGRVLVTSTEGQVNLQEYTDQRVCSQTGSLSQAGKLLSVSGNYHCNDGEQGTFSLTEVFATPHGFTGRLQRNAGTRSISGKLAWARIGG